MDTPKELYSSSADLHPSHWEKIVGADFRALAANSGFAWDGKVYSHDLLGDQVILDPEKKTVTYADRGATWAFRALSSAWPTSAGRWMCRCRAYW